MAYVFFVCFLDRVRGHVCHCALQQYQCFQMFMMRWHTPIIGIQEKSRFQSQAYVHACVTCVRAVFGFYKLMYFSMSIVFKALKILKIFGIQI
jgi:hypothetical protein